MTHLSIDQLSNIVKLTPLISIDLVIENRDNRFLLGYRTNRPAKGTWFVPGGRILKDETLADAFRRLAQVELGSSLEINSAQFLGVYEHFYSDNFKDTESTTHYVVLGYKIEITKPLENLPKEQHQDYRWFTKDELCSHEEVHQNTKAYFTNG